jgi:hypothetical protein
VFLVRLFFLAVATTCAGVARAEGETSTAVDNVLATARDEPSARWAVGFNPLAVAIGRYGGDLQYLVSPAFALLVNAHGDFASNVLPSIEYDRREPVWGFGGEAGFRWFSAQQWMHSFFLGASVIGGWYSVDYYGHRIGLPGVGLAGDMGGQLAMGSRVFLAFGGGLQYLWTARYPGDIAPGVSFVMGAGVNQRLLLTIGAQLP